MNELIDGRYRLERELGAGGMGRVFAAKDERTGKRVALKELLVPEDDKEQALQRAWFRRELKALIALDHPSILRLIEYGQLDAGTPYIVTELLEGMNLEDHVAANGPLPEKVGVLIAARVLSALVAAHAQSVVHRDIKPANLFLCTDGRVIVLDFGLARATSDAMGKTLAGGLDTQLVGTTAYLSPEQITGGALSPKSDLFSLGSTLFYLLSGEQPYKKASIIDTLRAIAGDDRKLLGDVARGLSDETILAVEHLMAFEPNERPDAPAAKREMDAAAKKLGAAPSALLDFAARGTNANATTIATRPAAAPTAKTTRRRGPWLWALPAILLLATAVALITPHAPSKAPAAVAPVVPAEIIDLPPTPPTPEAAPEVPTTPEPPPTAAPKSGTVKCSFAQWAEVTVDGVAQGKKQFSAVFSLPAGKHTLKFSHPKYGERSQVFLVRGGKETPCAVDFLD
ncbi:MAG: serine/threonine protein kinase [Deltaproteobacteria bacterium]|nr:serine/threonine protein kinase [Deltaproteobacteria bacterium]